MIAKAGQGAFGSVYVALWKGLVVAVKVMRQQAEGRRAMRTAWELAVTKSVSHPNIGERGIACGRGAGRRRGATGRAVPWMAREGGCRAKGRRSDRAR